MDMVEAYRKKSVELIADKINSGARRLSWVTAAGMGKTTIAVDVANEFAKNKRILMVFSHKASCEYANSLIQNTSIYCCTLRKFFEVKECDYDLIFFHEINDGNDRAEIVAKLQNYKGITISVFTPFQELVGKQNENSVNASKRLFAYTTRIYSAYAYVFETKTLIDVRDLKNVQDSVEEEFVRHEIITHISELKTETEEKEQNLSKLNQRLNKYVEELNKLRQEVDVKNQQLEEKEAIIEDQKKEIVDQKAELEEKDQMIEFLMSLLERKGYSRDILISSFDRIQKVRLSLQEQLESENEEVSESALKKLQDETVAILDELTSSDESESKSRIVVEKLLAKDITKAVWKKLSPKSRNFLVTAKLTYDSMTSMPDGDSLDYSGVCLLVTKAIEVETTIRFFDKYKEYLSHRFFSVNSWPFGLRKRENGRFIDAVIDDCDFTLGKVIAAIGVKRVKNDAGEVTGYEKNQVPYGIFLDYAKEKLYINMNRALLEQKIREDYLFVEKVRTDYRNPSAHKGELDKVSATECFNYVVEKQRELRRMLESMRF